MAGNPRKIDMAGQRFGRWTAIHQAGNAKGGAALWMCQCECGTRRAVIGGDLRSGKSISCGCHRNEVSGSRFRKHAASNTRLYETWRNMRARCGDPNNQRYGGRGIKVCDEWRDDFSAFQAWAMENGYSDLLTIERVNIDLGYQPDNCTFVSAAEQAGNRSIVSRAPDGELWWHKAKANGITRPAFEWRKNSGWPMELAVTWPMAKRRIMNPRDDSGRFLPR